MRLVAGIKSKASDRADKHHQPTIMKTDTSIMNSNNTETTTTNKPADEIYREFLPIDGRNTGLPSFVISMLRIGQILTAKEAVKREVTATRISALMDRHRNEIPSTYTAWEIREKLSRYDGEIKGGGVKIEWQEWPGKNYRLIPHYHFSFSRLYKPEDYVVKTEEVKSEP